MHGRTVADIPERYGFHKTRYNRFVRWRRRGVWDRNLSSVSEGYYGSVLRKALAERSTCASVARMPTRKDGQRSAPT